jgi:hypothetical protein
MGKQTFDRIRKTVAILLAVCFLVSLTAASASACKDKVVAAAPVAAAVADDANDRLGEELLDNFDDWAGNNWDGDDWLGDNWDGDNLVGDNWLGVGGCGIGCGVSSGCGCGCGNSCGCGCGCGCGNCITAALATGPFGIGGPFACGGLASLLAW